MPEKPSLRERFRYWFDNRFSGGPLVIIGWLALGTALLVILMTVLSLIPSIRPDGQDLKQVFWNILFQALTPNPFDTTTRWQFLVVMLVVTLGSLFMVSILIGTLTSSIESKVDDLRKGHSRVIESGHTLILGWSPQVFTILSELMIANENQKNARVVILADKDKVEMEDEICQKIETKGSTRIICRSGNPIDLTDLEIGSPHTAKSIIILPPEGNDPDTAVIKAILALTNNSHRRADPYHIVTQIRDPKNMEVVKMVGQADIVQAVLTGDLIARVTAQTSRQSGLSTVYTELLNFDGDEIYFTHEPSLVGKTYGEALMAYETSTVMGMKKGAQEASLNPPMDTLIEADDKLFALTEDDDTLIVSGMISVPVDETVIHPAFKSSTPKPEKCLVLGWNRCAATILTELNNYVPKGSRTLVVSDPTVSGEVAEAEQIIKQECSKLSNQKVSFQRGDTTDRRLLESIKAADYDHVIVLSYAGLNAQEADAKTLVTLLHLRNIAERDETPFSIVSEMLDLRNRELAEVANVDDFIVSDHLVSLMMAQLSEDANLFSVFADIFDPEGSEIYMKPIGDYVELGKPVNFYSLVEAARR
ncbi:MAG: CASTOR/POLLUX-related putative ion channel, partial [Anaerolineales bacterium]